MKTRIIIILVFVSVAFGVTRIVPLNKSSDQVNPGQPHTARDAWEVFDSTVLSAGDEPNDLAVDERTYLTVLAAAEGGDDKILVLLLHANNRQGWNRLKFRCRGITDNGAATWQIYTGVLGRAPISGTTDCELAKVGQLAFTIGTQVSTLATYEMADTLVVTEGFSSPRAWLSASPTSEHVAEGELDVTGADVVIAVPTTIAANSQLLITGY